MGKSKKSRKIREINVHGTRINSEFTPADIQWDIDDYCYPVPASEDQAATVAPGTQKPKKKKIHEKSAKSARKVRVIF